MLALLARDLLRHIYQTKLRFLCIAAIVALGIGFYSGLNISGFDMRQNLEEYLDRSHAYDLELISALGIDEETIADLKTIEGVKAVETSYTYDALVHTEDEDLTARFESYLGDGFNAPQIVSGRAPETTSEILAPASLMDSAKLRVGSLVSLKDPDAIDNKLAVHEFKVVGFVNSFEYLNTSLFGLSTQGSGIVQSYFFLDRNAFKKEMHPDRAFIFLERSIVKDGLLTKNNERIDDVKTQINTLVARTFSNKTRQKINSLSQDMLQYKNALRQGSPAVLKQLNAAKQALAALRKTAGLSSDQAARDEADLDAALERYRGELDALASRQSSSQKEIVVKNAYNEDFASSFKDGSDTRNPLGGFERGLAAAEQSLGALKSQEAALQEEIARLTQEAHRLQTQTSSAQEQARDKQPGSTQEHKKSETSKQDQATQARLIAAIQAKEAELVKIQEQIESMTKNLSQEKGRYDELKTKLAQEEKLQSLQVRDLFQLGDMTSWEEGMQQRSLPYAEGQQEFISLLTKSLVGIKRNIASFEENAERISSLGDTPYVLEDITNTLGVKSYLDDTQRLDNIARIFPLFFFAIALLVALTTMTRLCDDERPSIGIYVSLGFPRYFIYLKYCLYAIFASLLGMIVGIISGNSLFPWLIEIAYESIYAISPRIQIFSLEALLNPGILASSLTASLLLALFATLPSLYAQLKEKPAQILLKKAPVPGKKIFLERLGFWKSLNFSQKVSLRNVFRFRRRLFMMLVGIAGSSALLLVALGLFNAVNSAYTLQFESIQHYDGIARLSSVSSEEENSYPEGVENFDLHEQKILVKSGNEELMWTVLSPLEPDELPEGKTAPDFVNFIHLKEIDTKTALDIEKDSCIIPLKFAQEYKLGVGDEIQVFTSNLLGKASDNEVVLSITGIYENYIGNMIFMGSKAYTTAFPKQSKDLVSLVRSTQDTTSPELLSSAMQELSWVESFELSKEVQNRFERSLGAVSLVVALLVVSSVLLMIIVLYNLISINIQERIQEIATLKVLGFKKRELIRYFLREILIQLIMGSFLGLGLGSALLGFVISTAEVHYMSFVHNAGLLSSMLAFAGTLLIGLLICLATLPALYKIRMVESLKSRD